MIPGGSPKRETPFGAPDLDDRLSPAGLQMVEDAWLRKARPAEAHVQQEPYSTARRPGQNMFNLGWFGMRVTHPRPWHRHGSASTAILQYARNASTTGFQHYTSDEDFLTDVWLGPGSGARALLALPSHTYRRAVQSGTKPATQGGAPTTPHPLLPVAYRRFLARRRTSLHVDTSLWDEEVVLGT